MYRRLSYKTRSRKYENLPRFKKCVVWEWFCHSCQKLIHNLGVILPKHTFWDFIKTYFLSEILSKHIYCLRKFCQKIYYVYCLRIIVPERIILEMACHNISLIVNILHCIYLLSLFQILIGREIELELHCLLLGYLGGVGETSANPI